MKNVLKSQLEEYKRTNSKKSLNKMKSSIDTIGESYGSGLSSSASSAGEGSSNALNSAIVAANTALSRSTRNKAEITESVQNIISNMM